MVEKNNKEKTQMYDKNGEMINPANEENQVSIITKMAKDAVRVEDRTTDSDDFIASGLEVAFKNYTVSAGNRSIVRGDLFVYDDLHVIGDIKVIGDVYVGYGGE